MQKHIHPKSRIKVRREFLSYVGLSFVFLTFFIILSFASQIVRSQYIKNHTSYSFNYGYLHLQKSNITKTSEKIVKSNPIQNVTSSTSVPNTSLNITSTNIDISGGASGVVVSSTISTPSTHNTSTPTPTKVGGVQTPTISNISTTTTTTTTVIPTSTSISTPTLTPTQAPIPTSLLKEMWIPDLNTSWDIQAVTPITQSGNIKMYDIDLFDNSADVVKSLHAKGTKAICNVDVGTWESWRPDANNFPSSVKGSQNGSASELFLDIRKISILKPIMDARFDLCVSSGFDGIDPGNMDTYLQNTGFPLSANDQITYNIMLANEAHARNLSIALNNDVAQISELINYFDFDVTWQCFENLDCDLLQPFIDSGLAVFDVEFNADPTAYCGQSNSLNFNTIKKNLNLDSFRQSCR